MTNTMTDGPNGGSTWTGPPNPLDGLRRSDSDRWIAGVAGGVARRFDIAPLIVRLIGLVLIILGVGVPLYLLAWLLLPTDTRPAIATERGWNRNTVIAVSVLVVAGSIAVLGSDGVSPPWRAVPWIIIGAGVLLLIRSTHPDPPSGLWGGPTSGGTTPYPPPTGPGMPFPPPPGAGEPPFPTPPSPPSVPVDTTAITATSAPIAPTDPTNQVDADQVDADQIAGQSPAAQFGTTGASSDTTATRPWTSGRYRMDSPPQPVAPPAPPRPRRSPFLTPLTLFALLILAGASVLAGGHGWARPGVVAALALCIIAGALLLSAFIGRARGLIPVGVVVALCVLVGVAIGPKWDDIHNRSYAPTSVGQLRRTYSRGIGRTELDLRGLRLPAKGVAHVRVDQAIGQVVLWLPADARTQLSGHVSFGDIEYDRVNDESSRSDDSGTDARTDRTLTTGNGRARINVDLDLNAGQIRIHNDEDSSSTGPSSPSSPSTPSASTNVPTTSAPTTSVPSTTGPDTATTLPTVPSTPTLPGGN